MKNIYTYKGNNYYCDKCGWQGLGEELEQGELFKELVEMKCPKCKKLLETVALPTFDEVLQFGNEKEKKEVKKQMDFWEKWKALSLKSIGQLPEIEDDNSIFKIEERKYKKIDYLFIMYNGKEVWREPLLYEYYERFIELGKLLKEKYGRKMQDLVPPEYRSFLYGDHIPAPEIIEKFRKTLN